MKLRVGMTCRLPSLSPPAWGVLAVAILLSCVNSATVDEFTRQLRCGMTVEEARSAATSLGISTVHPMPRRSILYGTQEVAVGRLRVWLDFEANRLKWYRRGTQSGWTGMHVGAKQTVCSPGSFVSLIISASHNWSEADVRLDNTTIGALAPVGPIFVSGGGRSHGTSPSHGDSPRRCCVFI
jgi:hypothetical protein